MTLSDTFQKLGSIPLQALNDAADRVYWPYLVSSIFIGILWQGLVLREKRSLIQSLGFVFPKSAWSFSAIGVDMGFTWLSLLLQVSVLAGLATTLASAMEISVSSWGLPQWGRHGITLNDETLILIGTAALTLATDFALFLAHWLQHRIPALWRFHAVHHSAESLTPFTAYRQHPVDYLGNALCIGLMTGATFSLIDLLTGQPAKILHIEGSTFPFLLFYWLGYHLRHSDVWVDYGPRWSQILISPAQHQIHHSLESRHRDKNLGYMFAFWDRLFGTLYIPRSHEKLHYGLKENPVRGGFFSQLWLPIQQTLKAASPAGLVMAALVLVSVGLLFSSKSHQNRSVNSAGASIWIERMTAPEVADAIQHGFNQIIVPTGGTEQNGGHLALGKHNVIVQHNAEKLALRLGSTLIAPVMAYVPEGQISPPEGHMRFAGTLSLRESTFEAVLEDTITSLKAHGFRRVFLMGDSGGNQMAQNRVAQRLNLQWKGEPIQVIALTDYYSLEPQIHYLENQGFSTKAIGNHAGIRDTSELEFIAPELIRQTQLNPDSFDTSGGSDGNPDLASPLLGEFLTELKVKAAYRQATHTLPSSD